MDPIIDDTRSCSDSHPPEFPHVYPQNRRTTTTATTIEQRLVALRGGGLRLPAGYHPFGYKTTALGEQYLEFGGALESDVGRLLASIKTSRKSFHTIQTQWLEIVRVSKKAQSMRIYRSLQELIDFCIAAGLVN